MTESKVYSITEIKDILGVSRTKAYGFIKKAYLEQKPFRVIKVGDNYRIVKTSFDHWLEGGED